jgi:5-methylcytosine-specific restriction endonuclease McrA
MPRKSLPDKMCRKCRRRRPVAEFFAGLAEAPTSPRGSPFCQTCRETYRRCPACGEDVSIVDFQRRRPPCEDVCKRCFQESMTRFHAAMAGRIAERERAAGRDPADHPGYRYYTQSPDDIMRAPGRRRRERLQMVRRASYDRYEIFERDGWRCWICGEAVTEEDASIDHVVPIAQGGADAPDNLRTAHRDCNSRRGWLDPSGTTRMLVTSVDRKRWDRWKGYGEADRGDDQAV